jgi:hypothetical protein
MSTLSSALRPPNTLVFWKVRTRPSNAISLVFMPFKFFPRNITSPEAAARYPVMALNAVVLPAPLGPMSESTSPSRTSMLMSVMAARPPNLTDRLRI